MIKGEERKYRSIGLRMNEETIKKAIRALPQEDQDARIWHILKGVLQSTAATEDQCRMIRSLREFLNGNLAVYFNMTGVPGSEHGERLLQHAIVVNKDRLILAILEESEVNLNFESSELRSTPLLLAIMNGLSLEVIQKLITSFSIERKNTEGTTPQAAAKGKTDVLDELAEQKSAMMNSPDFFSSRKKVEITTDENIRKLSF